jgi:hypothetical protein
MQQNVPLPIDAGLAGLRNSDACAGKIPEFGRALSAFNSVQTDIDLRNRLLSLRVTHQGIPTPLIDVPDPSVPLTPQQSGFATQTITTDVPTVVAGQKVTVTGSGFPIGNDASTSLAVNMGHGEYGRPVQLINDRSTICAFGWTEVEWGPAGGTLTVERIPGIDTGTCPALYRPTGLTPRTTYQFRARDCDPITCSPWTPIARATTAQSDPNRGTTALTLDSGTSLGSFSVSNDGTFTTTVTIPSGTSAGTHTIRAASGGREARVDIGVTAPGAVRNATIRVADGSGAPGTCGFLTPGNGDGLQAAGGNITGSDIGGRIYGSGFAPGRVELRLGSATGPVVGTVTARADGTFCSDIPAVPANQVGDKVLVALQNGTVVAQINVKVFPGTRVG